MQRIISLNTDICFQNLLEMYSVDSRAQYIHKIILYRCEFYYGACDRSMFVCMRTSFRTVYYVLPLNELSKYAINLCILKIISI